MRVEQDDRQASEGGDVLNFFNEIVNFRNAEGGGQFEFNLSLIRSTDEGATWTKNATRITRFYPMDRVREDGVIDSEPVPCPDTRGSASPATTGTPAGPRKRLRLLFSQRHGGDPASAFSSLLAP